MIQTTCPHCQAPYKLPDAQLGKRVRCKGCTSTFTVEEAPPVLEEATAADLREAARRSTAPVDELPVLQDIVEEPRRRTAARAPAAPPFPPARRSRDEEDRFSSRDRDDRTAPLRRRDEEDRDYRRDRREPEPASGSGGMVLVLGACAAVFVLLLAGGGLAWFLASSPSDNPQAGANAPAEPGNPNPHPDPGGNPIGGNPPNDKTKEPEIKLPPVQTVPEPKDVGEALVMLKDVKTDVRRAGLNYLHRLPPAEREANREAVGKAVQPLLADRELGKDADNVLRGWRCKEIVPRLEEELATDNFHVWVRLLDVLGEIKADEAAELLARQLLVKDRTFWTAPQLRKQGKRAEKYVVKHMHHKNDGVRREVQNLLKDHYDTANDVILEQTVTDIASEEPETRKSALETLTRLKVAREHQAKVARALEGFLNDSDQNVRRRAVKALDGWGTEENIKALNGRLGDPDSQVRAATRKILARFKSEDSIEPLVLQLGARVPQDELLAIATMIVAYGEKAEKAVRVQLTNGNPNTRLAACQLLARIGTKDSLETLLKFAKADRNNSRAAMAARKEIMAREKAKADLEKEKGK
jgi:predicted Zn finger-like uncharacterized protein